MKEINKEKHVSMRKERMQNRSNKKNERLKEINKERQKERTNEITKERNKQSIKKDTQFERETQRKEVGTERREEERKKENELGLWKKHLQGCCGVGWGGGGVQPRHPNPPAVFLSRAKLASTKRVDFFPESIIKAFCL